MSEAVDSGSSSAALDAPDVPSQPDAQPDREDADLDKIDDLVAHAVAPILSAQGFYKNNSDAIHAAASAIGTLGAAGRALDDWVPTVDKVVDGLDGLAKSTAFPFVGVAVYLFKGVVQLETQRRENSKRSNALVLQMADMMGTLLELQNVRDPELKDPNTGQSVVGRVQALMSNIENDIRQCGNLIDTYAKHSVASKFFFSGQYGSQFKARADGLVSRKGDIVFALQIHNTVGIDAIQAEVKQTNEVLAKLIATLDQPSEHEQQLDRMMQDLGGRAKVLGNDNLMTKIAVTAQSRTTKDGEPGASTAAGDKISEKEDIVLTAAERHELRVPLDAILAQNEALYSQKLDAQCALITSRLDTLQTSSVTILHTLTGGPWERISHPDMQHIWKENGWRASVESRYFVLAIHDYYEDRFQRGSYAASNGVPSGTDSAALTDSDRWCLKYLSLKHMASLMEIFDADGSGFVRVAEVNEFCSTVPSGVNLLQWLAYWAHGWKLEASIYAHKIIGLLQAMRQMLNDVLLRNNRIIQRYFQGLKWMSDLNALVFAAAQFHHSSRTPLDKLVEAEMKRKDAERMAMLEKLSYTIDEPQSLELVRKSRRLEADILPIVYQILRHHCSLIHLSKSEVLDDREFGQAANSLTQTLRAIRDRISFLTAGWKQIGLDPASPITHFANGLYQYVYLQPTKVDADDVFDEDFTVEVNADIQDIINKTSTNLLRFGTWGLDTSGYRTSPDSDPLDLVTIDPETPISPIEVNPQTDLGLPAETFVRKVVLRLEHLATDVRYRFIKPAASLLRSIALAEHTRRPTLLTRLLILDITNTLNEILKIRTVENVTMVNESGSSVLMRMQGLLRRIEKDVKDCGHLINSFHAHNAHAGATHHTNFAQKFSDRSEGLARRRRDIIDALAIPLMHGIARFRAIVRTIIAQIADAHHSRSWAYLKERRENRQVYVSLVAKQLACAELRTIWNTEIALSSLEAAQLEAASQQLRHGDWDYYQSLAQLAHRSQWVHADRKCDGCNTMAIVGDRFLCTICPNFDLCLSCEERSMEGKLDSCGDHSAAHPMLKIARPVIKVDKYAFAGLGGMYDRILNAADDDSSSGSSVEFSDDESFDPASFTPNVCHEPEIISDQNATAAPGPSETKVPTPLVLSVAIPNSSPSPRRKPWSFTQVENLAENLKPWTGMGAQTETPTAMPVSVLQQSLATQTMAFATAAGTSAPRRESSKELETEAIGILAASASGEYRCVHCKLIKTGVRLVMTREHRGKQLCPPCESQLSKRHESDILPDYLRMLLKCCIPAPASLAVLTEAATPRPSNALGLEPASIAGTASPMPASSDRIETLESQLKAMEEKLSLILASFSNGNAKAH